MSELNVRNLNSHYSTNEDFLLRSNFLKNFVVLFNMALLVQKFIFINEILMFNGVLFIVLPLTFIIGRYIYKMVEIYRSYKNLKRFFEKLDLMYSEN